MQTECSTHYGNIDRRCEQATNTDKGIGIIGFQPQVSRQSAQKPSPQHVKGIDSFRAPQEGGEDSGNGQRVAARRHFVLESVPLHGGL